MKKNKGFTLLELLAVITILGLLALIVSPVVGDIIDDFQKISAQRSLEGYVDAVNSATVVYITEHNGSIPTSVKDVEEYLNFKNKEKIVRGSVKYDIQGNVVRSTAKIDKFSCVYEDGKGATCAEIVDTKYYTTLLSAIEDANNDIVSNGVKSSNGAKASIEKDSNGNILVTALEDATIDQIVTVGSAKGYTLDLNDKTITLLDGAYIAQYPNTKMTIEDSGTKGTIKKDVQSSTSVERLIYINAEGSTLTLNNGSYELKSVSNTNGLYAIIISKSNELVINSANITVNATHHASARSIGLLISDAKNVILNDAKIYSFSKSNDSRAINVQKSTQLNMTINRGKFYAESEEKMTAGLVIFNSVNNSQFTINEASFIVDNGYATYNETTTVLAGDAISNESFTSSLNINGGYYRGMNSGVSSANGTINGGTFESPNNGGIYFTGNVNIKNATLKLGTYKGKYPDFNANVKNNGIFYIGHNDREATVYMDNVTLISDYGDKPGVLSSNYNYKDTYLYVSNTKFPFTIRVDGPRSSSTNPTAMGHLYVGKNVTYTGITSGSSTGFVDTTTYANVEFLQD